MATKNDSLLPEDTAPTAGFDVSELRVNFSEEESASEGRSFEPIPGGKYTCCVYEWEVRTSTSAKNSGKPYWALRLKVQDGPYEGRVLFANVMLFEGALYSLAQLLKALGFTDALKTGVIPNGDELIGKPFTAIVQKKVDQYKIDQGEWTAGSGDPKPMKNEVSGYAALDQAKANSGGSLMP